MRTWLKKELTRLQELNKHPDPDLGIHESCGISVREAADKAAQAGNMDFFDRYKNVQATTPRDAVAILSSLLATMKPQRPTNDQGPDDGPFSVEQVAARLGVSKSKVYQDARIGLLPHRRLGRRMVIDAEQLSIYQANVEGEAPAMQFRFLP